ncbi:hypothetical protein VTK73DRAFT_4115 [Phialemonium thermophilum]|uniref:Zn(2)-C6 fungal-type domain-containing protein n=1 Tax=Phialemonium thermophilum TaxID=223376 RepID=A0ABR3VD50_9PEZI
MSATSPTPSPRPAALSPIASTAAAAAATASRNAAGESQARSVRSEPSQPQRKRRRIGYACNLCRAKKNRCDGERPSCGACLLRGQECVYSPQRSRVTVTQEYVDSLRERNRVLEEYILSRQPYDAPSSYVTTSRPLLQNTS